MKIKDVLTDEMNITQIEKDCGIKPGSLRNAK